MSKGNVVGLLVILVLFSSIGYAYYNKTIPFTGQIKENLAVIPNDWGNYNPNFSKWSGYGSDPQIVFLNTNVERTVGHPSIWMALPHTSADMNYARECDGIWYNVNVGDHIVFKCWMKTGLAQRSELNNDPTDSIGCGARIGMDFYHDNTNLMIGALVNGLGNDTVTIDGYPQLRSIGSDVPCNTPTWTQQIIDFIVPDGYNINQIVGWMQMRPEQGDTAQGWFADAELYINP